VGLNFVGIIESHFQVVLRNLLRDEVSDVLLAQTTNLFHLE
jgi:hypothetical protein